MVIILAKVMFMMVKPQLRELLSGLFFKKLEVKVTLRKHRLWWYWTVASLRNAWLHFTRVVF